MSVQICVNCKHANTPEDNEPCRWCHQAHKERSASFWEPRKIQTVQNAITVYACRHEGEKYCETEGSEHYKGGGMEPIDLMISKGLLEDFAIGNIIKYAVRFKSTSNLDDIKKIADYAHILCGYEILKKGEHAEGKDQSE